MLGHIPLATLARSDISRWVNAMRDAGASGKTVQNKMGFLSGCLNAAVREGLIAANPAAGVRLPRTVQREMRLPDAERIRLAADLVHPALVVAPGLPRGLGLPILRSHGTQVRRR